ncbi:DUF389 domain-containing protein [Micromonospora deserti]|uniref:DUF389 domain-containing protein n=1 Tax=Micromonospora deserti TaxID=2070366 RepID=A0A2W2DSM1_9ACTN|nr:DUF389 domain-containing protein [Micromonospora deserti]PZG02708.1 hypothetical protein C1I99_01575 [Micromonospora deserti]
MTAGKVSAMFVAGSFAALGLASGTLHLLIGAMIIAPGFEPFSRVALGLAHGSRARRRGLIDIVKGYGALTAGGAGGAVLCAIFGDGWIDAGVGSYLPAEALQRYFSTTTWSSGIVAVLGGAAGALLLVVNRRVLTAGVMVALALIPAFALTGMAVVGGEWGLAGRALGRGALDAAVVTVMSTIVFWWHRRTAHRRTRV